MKRHYTYVIYKESTAEYYIGMRSYEGNPHDDPYMGSSKYLKRRLHEGDWLKFIIQEYPTRQQAFEDETNCIRGHMDNGKCLNRSLGGGRWQELSLKARQLQITNSRTAMKRPDVKAAQSAAQRISHKGLNKGRKFDTKSRPPRTAEQLAKVSQSLKIALARPESKAKLSAAGKVCVACITCKKVVGILRFKNHKCVSRTP